MEKQIITLEAIKLVGITARTNNANEMDPAKAKIGQVISKYFGEGIADQIPNRSNPGVTYAVYTEYENEHHGEYTYFFGEAVDHFDDLPESLSTLLIPASSYTKFTTGSGPMPNVVIDAWQAIWQMTSDDFGGNRCYGADFEVYDARAADPQNAILDIFIGITQ